jgi:competence protein ComEC
MKSYLWPKSVFLYPLLFFILLGFLAFKDNIKSPKTHLKNGFYKIEAKALTNSEVKVLNPSYLKGDILHLNIKLPKDSYVRGYIKTAS